MAHDPIPLGPFDLYRLIGKGGMGLVWQGSHRASRQPVAIKTLRRESRDAESIAQFESEVRAVAALEHPGIVRVFDYGIIDEAAEEASQERLAAGCPYLAMELCEGGTVRQMVGHATWPGIRDLLYAILDTLAHPRAPGHPPRPQAREHPPAGAEADRLRHRADRRPRPHRRRREPRQLLR